MSFFCKVCSVSNRTFVREVDYATETAVDFNPQWVASSLSFSGNARRCGAGYDPCAWELSHQVPGSLVPWDLCRISMRFHRITFLVSFLKEVYDGKMGKNLATL